MEVVGMLSISPVWDDLLQAGTDELMSPVVTGDGFRCREELSGNH